MGRTSRSPYVQKMEDGTFWVEETPVGSIDGSNKTFTLTYSPNPTSSVELEVNGQTVSETGNYSVASDTLTTTYAYPKRTTLWIRYRTEPS